MPVTNQATAMETKCSQVPPVCQRLKEGETNQKPAEEAIQIDATQPGFPCLLLSFWNNSEYAVYTHSFPIDDTDSFCDLCWLASPQSALRSIMKRKADGEPGSPHTKKNLQFIGVNGG